MELFEGFGEADGFEGDFLFGGASDLLPFERDEEGLVFESGDEVDHVFAAVGAGAHLGLFGDGVATCFESGANHRLVNFAGGGVARHRFRG